MATAMETQPLKYHSPPVTDPREVEGPAPSSDSNRTEAALRSAKSRENTPSTLSSHSLDTAPLDRTTSSASTSITMEEGSASSFGQASQETRNDDEVERFLRKIDMEKKMQALQHRLELASVKATNGWTDMTINEIEKQRLTPKTARRRSNLSIDPTSPTSARPPYEPPSPSRPWQLIDVLWQPLPPPSNGRYPTSPASPSSPRKRSRDEYAHPSTRPGIFQQQQMQRSPMAPGQIPNGQHRRSSSTAFHASASPLRHFKEGEKKKRSHSHSTHSTSTTRQDVDAAKALTFMLGSGSGSGSQDGSQSPTQHMFGPPLDASEGQSTVTNSGGAKFRARAQSEVSPRKKRSASPPRDSAKGSAETDDKTAADLMLFLAHSPSPVTRVKPAPSRVNEVKGPSAARVLFQDPDPPKDNKEPRVPSNLASAPPITNSNETDMSDEIVAVESR